MNPHPTLYISVHLLVRKAQLYTFKGRPFMFLAAFSLAIFIIVIGLALIFETIDIAVFGIFLKLIFFPLFKQNNFNF
jgi:hypothetical protein